MVCTGANVALVKGWWIKMQNRKFLTAMLDMSRNGPLKVEAIKRFANIAKQMGYNALGLYMEDVYEIEGEPYFGHLRGRYTKAELKEVNTYLKKTSHFLINLSQNTNLFKTFV